MLRETRQGNHGQPDRPRRRGTPESQLGDGATVGLRAALAGLAAADQPTPRPSLAGTASQLLNVPRRGIEATGNAITTAATATLIDRNKRGRDQRRFWVLAIAAIHPAYRLTGFLLLIILAYAVLRVLPEYQASECSALRLGALRLAGIACRAAVQLALSLLAALGALTFAAVTLSRAGLEELKDRDPLRRAPGGGGGRARRTRSCRRRRGCASWRSAASRVRTGGWTWGCRR